MKNFDGKSHCHHDDENRQKQDRKLSQSPRAAAKPSYARSQRTPAETVPPDERQKLIALFQAGHYAELENRARILAKKHSNSGFIWKVLGVSLLIQGKDALSALKKTTILAPHDAEAHNSLGVALRDRGQLHDALESFQCALKHNPNYANAYNNRGITLQDLGELDSAVTDFRRALELNPHYPEAYNNLGNARQLQKQLDDAVESYRQALELKPDYAEVHNNLGNALQDLGHLEEAVASYRLALKFKTDYAEAYSNLANVLRELGNLEAAIASGRRAIEINPEYAEAHHNLANALETLGQSDLAVSGFRRALKINPNFAKSYCGLGLALKKVSHADAEASCRKALEIDPTLVEAMVSLAGLNADNGEFSEAEAMLRRAIGIDPDSAEAWAKFTHLRKMTSEDVTWLTKAEEISRRGLPPLKETVLRFALGKYFDDVKNFEQAFSNYRRANELTKLCGPGFDRLRHTQAYDMHCRNFGRDWVLRERRDANPSTRPIFIVGMPRSGTSLAEQILSSHSKVYGAGELSFWGAATSKLKLPDIIGESGDRMLHKLADEYLQLLQGLSPDAARVVDKMPANYQWLGLMHAAFPNARIIHMMRHPIDTCLSIYFQQFSGHYYSNDLEDLAHYYKEYMRLMEHWRRSLPQSAMLEVPYEELVADQEGWSRKMLEFVDLPWEDSCLDFHENVRTVNTASNWQVRQKITKTSVERWRHYEKFVGPLLQLVDQGRITIPPAAPMPDASAAAEGMKSKIDACQSHFNRGNTLRDCGQLHDAIGSFRQAVDLNPDYAEAHNNLGNVLRDVGKFDEALASFKLALQINPEYAAAHYNLGNAWRDIERPDEAVLSYRRALTFGLDLAQVHNNLGIALRDSGRPDQAVASYGQALTLMPQYAEAYNNMSVALRDLRQLTESTASSRRALELNPAYADAYYNLGVSLHNLGRLTDAVANFRQALALKPDFPDALNNLGNALSDQGQLDAALACYRQALEKKTDFAVAHSNLLFALNYLPEQPASALLAEARRFGNRAAQRATPYTEWDNVPAPHRCLRIGLVSGDLRDHPVGYFIAGVLAALATTAAGKMEFIGYHNHRSGAGEPTQLTERIKACCHDWRETTDMSDAMLARKIRDDGIDILIDLSGHTAHNRLPMFAWKPAPVQITWLGYFATTGVAGINYLLADPWTLPESEEPNFTEKIWRLPETRLCFTTPEAEAGANLEASPLPALENGYLTFGCFNTLTKMNDAVVALWARVLRAVPKSKLFLKAKQLDENAARQSVMERFAAHGIERGRLILEGPARRSEYLAAYRRVDIALDPFPFPGGATSAEALWMGVPVLTLSGERFLSRQGAGLLMSAGLPQWIAADADDYVARAVSHACDLQRLAALRSGLRQQISTSPLMDAARFSGHFESALRGMWARWCDKEIA